MNRKKVVKQGVIGLLAACLIFTLFFVVIPKALATTGCFDDTNGHIFETYICWMDDHGITSGCGGGNFCPNDGVTRGQMSVFIKRVFDLAEANDDDTLGDLSCSTDEIAKWNGSAWVCEPLSNYYTKSEVDKMISSLTSRITTLEEKPASVTTENSGQDIVFTGVNVHLRDGTGDTGGTVNGLGNLIVGYNEDAGSDAVRTGSHNLVLGVEHSYSSYGGFVTGYANTISGAYSSVSGGRNNTASADYSSGVGGRNNTVSGQYASVSGGNNNTASGLYSSVLGGGGSSMSWGNEAWANYSVVVGGKINVAGKEGGGDRWVGEGSVVLAG
jgi:hypothetical protein